MTAPASVKRFLIGPGAVDCNRGDQALLWEAVDCLRRLHADAEIAVCSDGAGDTTDPQSRQSRRLGLRVLPPLLPNPRRAVTETDATVIDGRRTRWRMALQAVIDFVTACWLWCVAPSERLTRICFHGPRAETVEYLRGAEALVIKGGGYLYAHRGPRWWYFLWFGLFPLTLAQRLGVKTVILPNSIGPVESAAARWCARRVLTRCTWLSVRDDASAELLTGLLGRPVTSWPDMAFRLRAASADEAVEILEAHGVPFRDRRCVGIVMRPWRFPGARDPRRCYERYLQAHVGLINRLVARGDVPVLVVHSRGPHAHEDDRRALDDLQRHLAGRDLIRLDGDFDCRQLKAVYGRLWAVVTTRLHAAIFALDQGVPCAVVAYQGTKAQGVMRSWGLESFLWSIDTVTAEDLAACVEAFDQRYDELTGHLRQVGAQVRRRLNDLDTTLAEVLR